MCSTISAYQEHFKRPPKRIEKQVIKQKKKRQDIEPVSYRGEKRSESLIEYDVPYHIDTNFKSYMSYRTITSRNSPQYILQQRSYTGDYGIRMCDGYYLIALGSHYGTEIGSKYKITLSNGHVFYAMLGDCKSDSHTDYTNRYMPNNGNMVEFIVDLSYVPPIVKKMGTFSALNIFDGRIERIQMIKES